MDAREKPTRPIVGVGTVVIRNDQILLIRRSKPPKADAWSLPGGAQELGETLEDAAIRETLEETGLEVKILGLLDVVDFIDRDATGAPLYHYSLVDYLAVPLGGSLKAGTDAHDARFFNLEAVRQLPLWSETVRIIEMAVKQMAQKEKADAK